MSDNMNIGSIIVDSIVGVIKVNKGKVFIDTNKLWDIGKICETTQKKTITLADSLQKVVKSLNFVEDILQLHDEQIEKQIKLMNDQAHRCGMAASYIFTMARMYEEKETELQKSFGNANAVLFPDEKNIESVVPNEKYTIQRGDTLTAIAKRYNTTVDELVRLNNISNPNLIIAGESLLIPISGVTSGNTSTNSKNNVEKNKSMPVQPQNITANNAKLSVDVPYYSQGDSRWSGKKIGTKTIGNVGCLVTSLAMTESACTGNVITPDEMVGKLSFDNNSLYWNSAEKLGYKIESCPQTTKGLSSTQYQTIYEQLKQGHPVIIGGAVNANDKGNNQHWVVITGYNGDGMSFSPSDFTINDPGKASRKTLADFFAYKPYPVRMLYKNN